MPEPLTPVEAARLLGAVGGGFAGLRDRAYIATLYGCGLRSNECRMLDMEDLRMDCDPWTLRVRHPKGVARGASPRTLGVPDLTRRCIEEYLTLRGKRTGPLYMSGTGGRMDTSHYRRKIPQLAKSAGIPRRVHPHAFRHTFARELNDENVSMRLIQLALGHRRLDTTATYLQSLGDPEVIAMTGSRHSDAGEDAT